MPKLGPGRFDENACLRWMVRHQAELIKRRESETSSKSADDVRRERAALLKLKTQDAEYDLAERRGELVPVEALTRAMSGTILSVRQHLLPLPDRVAQQLVGESANSIRERLRVEVHTLLIQLTIPAAYREPGACDVCGGPKPMLGIDPIPRVPCAKTATNPLGTRHAPGTNGHGSNGTGR